MTWQEKSEYLRIIEHYGTEIQRKKLMEEAYELAETIQDFELAALYLPAGLRNEESTKAHILEEVADVSVLLQEVTEYYDLDQVEVLRVIGEKVARTLERMK